MPKLRISVVQYLNTSPLVWGFTHGLLAGKYDLSFTVPSQCAEQLRNGDVDIAIIPAIEYQRIDNLVILPDLAIASKRRVRSLLLVSKVPITDAKSIALDRSSRSTQALTKILCARHWKIAPQFREMSPDLHSMLATNDAALLIGDPALRVSLAIESRRGTAPPCPLPSSPLSGSADPVGAGLAPPVLSSSSAPPFDQSTSSTRPGSTGTLAGDFSSTSAHSQSLPPSSAPQSTAPEICDAKTLGVGGTDKLYVYDIVEQWRCMTNLSAVLAVWAARPSVATPDVVADFHASRAFGLLHLPELCDASSAQLHLPAPALHRYLTDNIDFTLDPENIAALTRFFVEASALDLTPPAKPVLLAPGPKASVLEPAAITSMRGSLNGAALDVLYEERKRNREL